MKTLPMTRARKEQICAILSAGGSISTVDGDLARTSYAAREAVAEEWTRRRRLRGKPVPQVQGSAAHERAVEAAAHCRANGCAGPLADGCPITGNVHCP